MNKSLEEKFALAAYPKGQLKSAYLDLDSFAEKVPDDEEVLVVAMGTLLGKKSKSIALGTDMGGFATLVLTDKCLHMFGRGAGFGPKKLGRTESYTFATITGVSRQKKMMAGWTMEISRASNVDDFIQLDETDSENLYNQLRNLVAEAQKGNSGTVIQQATDPVEQIKKLKELLDLGVISQEEFETKKQTLLDKI